jgi:hypothetical protein
MEVFKLQLIHLIVLSGQDHLNDITKHLIYLFSIFIYFILFITFILIIIFLWNLCKYKIIKKIIIILSLNILITNYIHSSTQI